MRIFPALFLIVLTAQSGVGEMGAAEALERWGRSIESDRRVVAEILRFEEEEGAFYDGYAERLARSIRRLVFSEAAERIDTALKENFDTMVEVSFPKPGFAAPIRDMKGKKQAREFEDSFVRTEVLVFLETKIVPDEALRIYTSPDFRMQMSSRIKRIWEEDCKSCIEIDGVKMLLDPTLSCSAITELREEGLSAQHSQVVFNSDDGDYQKVYFKESLKTFVSVPDGLVLHYVNYVRSAGLGRVSKYVARGKIADSQEEAIEELQSRLAAAESSE
jgi:hypothetical protein